MDIPEDVVTQILVRLPVKSLLRFRCVCKHWCGLIGSRRFIDMHLRHPPQGKENEYLVLRRFELGLGLHQYHLLLSFYCQDQDAVLTAVAPDLRGFRFPDILSIGGPVNGVCILAGFEFYDVERPLYLFNPATREFRKIPDRPFGKPSRTAGIVSAPFECRRVSVGLGYDPRTSEYKVVSIMLFLEHYAYSFYPRGPLKIEIFDLSSNSWRVADTVFPTIQVPPEMDSADLNTDSERQGMFEEFSCGLFLNGSIHWHPAANYTMVILAFNISDEVMRAFDLPRDISLYQNVLHRALFVLDDSLAFVQKDMIQEVDYSFATSFYVWVMMEYGDAESWVKRFYFQPGIPLDVLASWNDVLFCEAEDGELVSCNFREDGPRRFTKHHHITRHVPELSNQQRLWQGYYWQTMGAVVMRKESLVRVGRCS